MKNIFIGIIASVLVMSGAFVLNNRSKPVVPDMADSTVSASVVVHKSPTCGCCGNYVSYLKKEGYDVEVMNHDDMSTVKDEYGIPRELESCHTTDYGDYVVEGHVPAKSVAKMLNETPLIAGIGMPGMPSGAPGMGGRKSGPFEVFGFTEAGEVTPFDQQ